MKKFDPLALANTFAVVDLFLHPAFHLWGWLAPRSYEVVMGEFVIGLHLNVQEVFSPKFFAFWILEAAAMWLLGYTVATVYNKISK